MVSTHISLTYPFTSPDRIWPKWNPPRRRKKKFLKKKEEKKKFIDFVVVVAVVERKWVACWTFNLALPAATRCAKVVMRRGRHVKTSTTAIFFHSSTTKWPCVWGANRFGSPELSNVSPQRRLSYLLLLKKERAAAAAKVRQLLLLHHHQFSFISSDSTDRIQRSIQSFNTRTYCNTCRDKDDAPPTTGEEKLNEIRVEGERREEEEEKKNRARKRDGWKPEKKRRGEQVREVTSKMDIG